MKGVIIKEWPPVMKVTGNIIKAFFEVKTTDTVKKKLYEYGVSFGDYVVTDTIIAAIEDNQQGEVFVSYEGKSEGSDKLG